MKSIILYNCKSCFFKRKCLITIILPLTRISPPSLIRVQDKGSREEQAGPPPPGHYFPATLPVDIVTDINHTIKVLLLSDCWAAHFCVELIFMRYNYCFIGYFLKYFLFKNNIF